MLAGLAGVMTPPYNVVLASNRAEWGDAPAMLMADIVGRGFPLPGATGPVDLAWRFAALHQEQTGQANRIRLQMRAFELRKVMPLEYAPGRMRTAGRQDTEVLVGWARAFNQEAMPAGAPDEVETIVDKRIQSHANKLANQLTRTLIKIRSGLGEYQQLGDIPDDVLQINQVVGSAVNGLTSDWLSNPD